MPEHKTYFNWSTGKDSALALHYLLQDKNFCVDYLLTTVNSPLNRVSMHGVRAALLEQQVKAIGIPNGIVELPEHTTNATYEKRMSDMLQPLKAQGYEYAAFGDILLEDLRQYREQQLSAFDIRAVFPLWKRDTKQLIREFIGLGFKAIVVCVDAALLDPSFTGRVIDSEFIHDLPAGVDPCGENGEFHTFCYDAPFFKNPVPFSIGETVFRKYNDEQGSGFWFCDLLAKNGNAPS